MLIFSIFSFSEPYSKVELTKKMILNNIAYEKACEDGNMTSCYEVAKAYEPLNTEHSILIHTRACTLGEAKSCWQLGKIYREGKGTKRNFEYSYEYYNKSCERGLGEGCFELGKIHYYGINAPRSLNKAMKYYQIACGHGHTRSCSNVAFMYNGKIAPIQEMGLYQNEKGVIYFDGEEREDEELFPGYFDWIDRAEEDFPI